MVGSGYIYGNIKSKGKFEEKLKKLGHFSTIFESSSELHNQFNSQLQKLMEDDLI